MPESRFVVADTLVRFDHVLGVADVLSGDARALDGPLPPVPRGDGRRGALRRFPDQAEHERRVRAREGVHPRGRRVPDRRLAARRAADVRVRARALPRAAPDQPVAVPLPARAGRARADRLLAGDASSSATARARELNPIAGSIAPGEGDAEALLSSEKDRAEHVMLVDLGRNDLSRVCRPGHGARRALPRARALLAHHAPRLGGRRRAARRRHAVRPAARVLPRGNGLRRAEDPRDADHLRARGLPARASTRGAVGYALPGGALDTCIAIRTIVLADGLARLQAGGGIVADSDPAEEHQECLNKLAALEAAIELAEAEQR